MPSILYAIQQEIADRLLADPFFSMIPVLVEQPRDMTYELQASVAAAGIWGVVLVPQAQVTAPNAPGPIFDPVEFAIRFRANLPLAGGPGALETAETALALLHLYRPTTVNEVLCAAPNALQRVIEPDVVAYEVRVRTQAGALYPVAQVETPVAASAGTQSPQVVTLSSATGGAAIFYTVDGTAPAPRSESAYLYAGPVTVSGSGVLRARAWLAGYLASAEMQETFT